LIAILMAKFVQKKAVGSFTSVPGQKSGPPKRAA
jgi:hypothetical protein